MSEAEFIVTKEYRRFAEFCDVCRRERYIGLCYGPPGVGKTLSARQYAAWAQIAPALVTMGHSIAVPVLPVETLANRTVFYTATLSNTPRRIDEDLDSLFRGFDILVEEALHPDAEGFNLPTQRYTALLIVDEADRLKMPGLEQLRDIYDRKHIGLVLIGMPGLEKRLARYAQLYSRVGFAHQFRALSIEEMRFILMHKWREMGLTLAPDDFTDAEALAAMIRITGGNFRLVQRLCSQIARIMEINALRTVTAEVVEAARENLVIGPLT
jgi:DNA transposition AAA+ family ATPase